MSRASMSCLNRWNSLWSIFKEVSPPNAEHGGVKQKHVFGTTVVPKLDE